jgi:hypothetical protein
LRVDGAGACKEGQHDCPHSGLSPEVRLVELALMAVTAVTEPHVQPARPCVVCCLGASSQLCVAIRPLSGRPPEKAGTTGLTSLALFWFLEVVVRVTLPVGVAFARNLM